MAEPISDSLITDAPLTAEAREALLREQFADDFPHDGKLFVPDDHFYAATAPTKQANLMRDQLCDWLGIPKKQIGLVFENDKRDTNDSSNYRIFIETEVLQNEFKLGASLGHALVRYLIEDRKHIRLNAAEQQAALLSTASILFGLGIVISNGLMPRYPWLEAAGIHKHTRTDLLGNVQPGQYHQQVRTYLKRYRVPQVHYAASCTPWTAHRLGIKLPGRTTHAVYTAKHRVHITRLKVVGTTWLAITLVGFGGLIAAQRVAPMNHQAQAAQDQALLLKQLAQICHDTVSYDRQYTDTSDLLSQQTVNAQAARCTSLDNQLKAAESTYDSLSTE